MKNSEMREGDYRKGREGEQEVLHFYDEKTNRVAAFNKDTGKFISGWKLDRPRQKDRFLKTNNIQ